jgi:hypothetical protein
MKFDAATLGRVRALALAAVVIIVVLAYLLSRR